MNNSWTPESARALTAPEEVQVVTQHPDGSTGAPRTIWIVGDGDRVFVRSTNGRSAAWFRAAVAAGSGQVVAGGATYDVRFTEAAEDDLTRVDEAYRSKYGHYAAIVDHLHSPGPRAATLEVHPA